MKHPTNVLLWIALASAFPLLAQCGPSEQMQAFTKANELTTVSVPFAGRGREADWSALDCAAVELARERAVPVVSRARVTIQADGGFDQPPAVLTREDGDRRVFAFYGFYQSEEDRASAKDDRIGEAIRVDDFSRSDMCR